MDAAAARAAIAEVDGSVPIHAVRTMDSVVTEAVGGRAFQATLLLLFGAIAAILAGVGVFGVMANAVAQRSKEMGIRLALGASPASVRRMVLANVVRLVAGGVALGVPLAVAAGFALRDILFGVTPQNPAVLAAAATVVVVVGIVAGWIPARRAVRVDPAATLRAE
jgi:ABC-type antimicrobial peptide transport system permease subunit